MSEGSARRRHKANGEAQPKLVRMCCGLPSRQLNSGRFGGTAFACIHAKVGEPARSRTENQQIKSLLLCQLSYGPTWVDMPSREIKTSAGKP